MYGLINLAGRQLLPNILASLAFSRTGQLERNVILHSDNRQESALPAKRMLDVLQHDPFNSDVVHMPCEVDDTVQGVREAATELFDEFPALTWILHATGGNKMMSAALVDLARHPRVEATIYHDLFKGWQQVSVDAHGQLVEAPISPNCGDLGCLLNPEVRLDRLPLLDLIRAQFVDNSAMSHMTASEPLENVDPEAWIRRVSKDPSRSFVNHVDAGGALGGNGSAFEAFLCKILQAAGATQVLWNCQGFGSSGAPILECDVVGVHGDRIAIYDAKIDRPQSPGKTEQIRSALETTRMLGGLSATSVLVRPNWPASVGVRSFADAMKVRLITSQDRAGFVQRMLEPLGLQGAMGNRRSLAQIQSTLDTIYRKFPQHPFLHG